jgi:outer membrane receptor protein involved in Fe transport
MKNAIRRHDCPASPLLLCNPLVHPVVGLASLLPRLLRWWCLGALLPVLAPAEPVEFNLPAQPTAEALLAFSKQARIEVLFSSDELRLIQSAAVTGFHEPEAALSRLLLGTGFVARQNRKGKYVVTRVKRAVGSIMGKLLAADGTPARGVRVTIPGMRLSTATDERGEFTFAAVLPGTYRLVAAGPSFKPLLLADLKVEANRVLALSPQTLQAAGELVRLDPYVVKAESAWPIDPSWDALAPRLAGGNLDLPRTDDDPLPYTIYNRAQIARSGVVNLNEFLQRELLDSDATKRPPEQGGSPNSFDTGSSNLNLRGYGADQTVVLVNGRRLPEMLTNAFNNTSAQPPDVNFIPLSLVERVEVLPVSASALYSGNAVGGAINIVLRPDVDANATEVTAIYTNAVHGFDAPQSSLSLLHGQTLLDGTLRVRINATLTRATPPTESELGYIQANLRAHPGPMDFLHRATPNIRSADGSPLFGPGSATVTSVAPGADGTGGLEAFAGRQGVPSLGLFKSPGGLATSPDSLDYAYGRRQQGATYFASATYDLFPWLQLGLDGIYVHTVINRGYNIFAGNLQLPADSPLNPFHQDLAVSLNETGPRLGQCFSEARLDFSSVVAGLLLKLPANWRVSLDGQFGHNTTKYRGIAGADGDRWQQLVDAGVYNPLRDTQVHGPPPQFYDEVLKYYGGKGRFVTLGDYDTLDTALRITNQSLALPTGNGAATLGGDYRLSRLKSYTDEQRYGDGSLVDTPTLWAGRTLERISVFGEFQAPLLPPRWLPHWIREVATDLAVRYVAADTTQETNVAPTGGLKIGLANGLALRATVATSNRFPSPYLSRKVANPDGSTGAGEVSSVSIFDPVRNQSYNVPASDALNPNLRPEAAVTRTAGLVFQRGQKHRFRASVDFVDTRKSGELSYLDAQAVVNLEGLLPGRVDRAPRAPGDANAAGLVTAVRTGNFNLAWRHSQNWNTSLDYAWTECLGGQLDLYGRWVYFQRYQVQVLPESPVVDELREPDGAAASLLKHRMNFGAGWSTRNYGFGLDGHYFHSRVLPVFEWPSQGHRQINPSWQFDAYLQSDLARWLPWRSSRFGLRGQLRVNNVFGADFPKYANDPSGAGVQPYGDWRGRTFSLSLTATF